MNAAPAMQLALFVFLGAVALPPTLVVSIVGLIAVARARAALSRARAWESAVRRLSWTGPGDPAAGPICVEGTAEATDQVPSLIDGVPCVGSSLEVRAPRMGKVRLRASEVAAFSLVAPEVTLTIDYDNGARLLGGHAVLLSEVTGPTAPEGLDRTLEALSAGDVAGRKGRVLEWVLEHGDTCTVLGELHRDVSGQAVEGPYRGDGQLRLAAGRSGLFVVASSRQALLARLRREGGYAWGKLGVVALAVVGLVLGFLHLFSSENTFWTIYLSPLVLFGLTALEASRRKPCLAELPRPIRFR